MPTLDKSKKYNLLAPTQEDILELQQIFSYDPDVGLHWRSHPSQPHLDGARIRAPAGKFRLNGFFLRTPRLCWMLHHSAPPTKPYVLFKDGNKANQALSNLELSTQSLTQEQMRKSNEHSRAYNGKAKDYPAPLDYLPEHLKEPGVILRSLFMYYSENDIAFPAFEQDIMQALEEICEETR